MLENPQLWWDARYRLVKTLGVGGMGRVVLAHDRLQGDRAVALKRLLPEHAAETPAFLREFAIHRQLAHPSIPRAYELGHAWDGGVLCPYFTMEVSSGMPLNDLIARAERGLPLRAIVQIVTGLLRALDHLHRRRVVHGDLKPGNVLVSERYEGLHPHLIDFGIAGPIGTPTGDALITTPEYAAPELLGGAPFDPRADLYAVGLVLYELVEHRRPWLETDIQELLEARSSDRPPALTSPACPPALATLIRRLLAAAPEERPRDAATVLAELSAATGWEAEIEPADAFVQHLLTVPLPWRAELQSIARGVIDRGDPWAAVIDLPPGYFARRLLGPVLDVAAATGARVVPVRFDERFGESPAGELADLLRPDKRPLVVVIENLEAADEETLALLERARRPDTRVVATRRPDPRGDVPLPRFLTGPGVRSCELAPWSEEAMRAWIHEALGDCGMPLEALESLPPTPAALVEAMGALQRDGHLERSGDGYTFRVEGRVFVSSASLEPTRRLETLDALLACIKSPVPEGALAAYLSSWVDVIPDLVARGVVLARGDGTMQVADESRRAITYGRIAKARRDAMHRRLAQALEEVSATPHRIADEWLQSDAPLLAVPHLLAAAEMRPGRSWLDHSLALVQRARGLIASMALYHRNVANDLELWRYDALAVKTEARVLLACGELAPVGKLVEGLLGLGMEMGHRHTLMTALELRIELDLRTRNWDALVGHALTLVTLSGEPSSPETTEARARLHWARAMRFRGEGLPAAALTELDAGLSSLPEYGATEVRLKLLHARAELCLEVQWRTIGEEAIGQFLDVATRAGRAEDKARARVLESARLRGSGRIDRALTLAQETAATLPRQRTPRLDAEVELELGQCHLELGEFEAAQEHARFAAALAHEDGDEVIEAHAVALVATAAWYLGNLEVAWRMAQRAARPLVLELTLAARGFAGAEEVLREASEAGYHAQRRVERARAARFFRIAAEAALLRKEPRLASDQAERALSCLVAEGGRHLHIPRHLVTAARAWAARGDRSKADELLTQARTEVMAIAEGIEDGERREQWLAHPDQKVVLGAGIYGQQAVPPLRG